MPEMDTMDRIGKCFFLGLLGVAGLLFGTLFANEAGVFGTPLVQLIHQLTVGGLVALVILGLGAFLTISAAVGFVRIK